MDYCTTAIGRFRSSWQDDLLQDEGVHSAREERYETREIEPEPAPAAVLDYSSAHVRLLEQRYLAGMHEIPEALNQVTLDQEKKTLLFDLTQMTLSIAGIFEPTPVADGADALISLVRGDWVGAGISAAGMVPYLGDLAKVGKLGKYAKVIEKTVELAAKDTAFARLLAPTLTRLKELLDRAPIDSLPSAVREPLSALKKNVHEILNITLTSIGRLKGVPKPSVTDTKLGNLVEDLYKGTRTNQPIGTGSTADAIRHERSTGQQVGNKWHTQKGEDYARALEKWLAKNPNASASDRAAAQAILNDLRNALEGK